MSRTNSRQRKHRWNVCERRDGIGCKFHQKPWCHRLTRVDIEAFARKHKIAIPEGLSEAEFMSRAEKATKPFDLLAYKYLKIDHINNNNRDNPRDGSNWQLSCQSGNIAKNPPRGRRGPKFKTGKWKEISTERVRERLKEATRALEQVNDSQRSISMEVLINRAAEKKFRKWIELKLKKYGEWEMQDAINAGAEFAEVNPQTTARWLKKMLSSEGKLTTESRDGWTYIQFKQKQEEVVEAAA